MLSLILSHMKKYVLLIIKCNAGIFTDPTLGVGGKAKGHFGRNFNMKYVRQ